MNWYYHYILSSQLNKKWGNDFILQLLTYCKFTVTTDRTIKIKRTFWGTKGSFKSTLTTYVSFTEPSRAGKNTYPQGPLNPLQEEKLLKDYWPNMTVSLLLAKQQMEDDFDTNLKICLDTYLKIWQGKSGNVRENSKCYLD